LDWNRIVDRVNPMGRQAGRSPAVSAFFDNTSSQFHVWPRQRSSGAILVPFFRCKPDQPSGSNVAVKSGVSLQKGILATEQKRDFHRETC